MGYQRLLTRERRPFETQDGHICILVYSDKQWEAFCRLIGRPEMWGSDPRLTDLTTRTRHVHELYGLVADAMRTKTTAEWMALLQEADIPSNPLHTPQSLLHDEHLTAVGFFPEVQHPSEGLLRGMAVPGCWSRSVPSVRRHAPRLGEHSVEVLAEAGLDAAQIDALLASGATRQA
jgi:crotonobetainyl-CoA:carnitine CoA-transferase CaiB-like acyl-CoA transferase